MGFRPSSGRSLLFAFRVDVTAKRENYALFDFETLQATSQPHFSEKNHIVHYL